MLPYGVEVVDYTTLPADAHSIQRLKDKLISRYSHHGFLIMTVVSWEEVLMHSKLIHSDACCFLHRNTLFIGLRVSQDSLSRNLQQAQRPEKAKLRQPPCLDHCKGPHDRACTVSLHDHSSWTSRLQHIHRRGLTTYHGGHHSDRNIYLYRRVSARTAVLELGCTVD